MERFALLGAFGWCVEMVFTATMDSLVPLFVLSPSDGDDARVMKLEGKSYLWMHPVYGGGLYLGTILVPMLRDKKVAFPMRLLLGVSVCFSIEYAAGWVLQRTIGLCPWDYSQAAWNVHGLVRLDYAPAWAFLSCLVELLADVLDRIRIVSSSEDAASTGAASRKRD